MLVVSLRVKSGFSCASTRTTLYSHVMPISTHALQTLGRFHSLDAEVLVLQGLHLDHEHVWVVALSHVHVFNIAYVRSYFWHLNSNWFTQLSRLCSLMYGSNHRGFIWDYAVCTKLAIVSL